MEIFSHTTVTMNAMQAQLKTFSSTPTKPTRPKRMYYFWSFWSNYTSGSKTCWTKKGGHKEESYYKKQLVGRKKWSGWRLGAIFNKIEISNPKNILINFIWTPQNVPSNNMLEISDSGANIQLAKQATTTMAPVIMSNETIERLSDGSTMDSSHIATLHI